LLADGHDVCVLDNFATGRRENLVGLGGVIEVIEGDIQSYERVHNAIRGCEVVFHEAALPSVPRSIQDPLTSNAVNVIGTLDVLLAARDSDGASPELPEARGSAGSADLSDHVGEVDRRGRLTLALLEPRHRVGEARERARERHLGGHGRIPSTSATSAILRPPANRSATQLRSRSFSSASAHPSRTRTS